MMRLRLGQVRDWTGGTLEHVDASQIVRKMTIDSRDAAPDVLFVALAGTKTDGHVFVQEVWALGGMAMVRDDFPDSGGPALRVASPLEAMGRLLRRYLDEHQVTVVGVTGSVGKTSVKELSAAVLRQRFVTTSSLGNYNTAIGLPLSFFAGNPDATHFVAEMGMRGLGEIQHLTEIAPPQVAVISSIGPSHLEMMGSMEAIQQAKGEILTGLRPDGVAVLNGDNAWVRELGQRTSHRVVWFGRCEDADVRIESSTVEENGTDIQLTAWGASTWVHLPWLGDHHAYNVAAALLVGRALGMGREESVAGIEAVDRSNSRIRVVSIGTMTVLEDVYNSSPLSSQAALDVLASRSGRRIAVLGDMLELGSYEVAGHQEIGAYALGRADQLLAVGPRAHHTYEAGRQAGLTSIWAATRQEAVAWLKATLKPGDVVLLKASRGMEFERITEALLEWGAQL